MEIKVMKAIHKDGREMRVFKDAETNDILQAGFVRPIEDFIDEVKKQNNECAVFLESITSRKGIKYYTWLDIEINEVYVTRIED